MVAYRTRASCSREARASDMAEGSLVLGGMKASEVFNRSGCHWNLEMFLQKRRYRLRSKFEPNSENTIWCASLSHHHFLTAAKWGGAFLGPVYTNAAAFEGVMPLDRQKCLFFCIL